VDFIVLVADVGDPASGDEQGATRVRLDRFAKFVEIADLVDQPTDKGADQATDRAADSRSDGCRNATIRAQTAPMPKVKMPSAADRESDGDATPRPTTGRLRPATESVPAGALNSQCRIGRMPLLVKLGKACAKRTGRARSGLAHLVRTWAGDRQVGPATRVARRCAGQSPSGCRPNGFEGAGFLPVIVMVRGVCSFKRLNQSTALPTKKARTAPVARREGRSLRRFPRRRRQSQEQAERGADAGARRHAGEDSLHRSGVVAAGVVCRTSGHGAGS
jgi:hypothetical protein